MWWDPEVRARMEAFVERLQKSKMGKLYFENLSAFNLCLKTTTSFQMGDCYTGYDSQFCQGDFRRAMGPCGYRTCKEGITF